MSGNSHQYVIRKQGFQQLQNYNMKQQTNIIKEQQIRQTDFIRGTQFAQIIRQTYSIMKQKTLIDIDESVVLPKQQMRYELIANQHIPTQLNILKCLNDQSNQKQKQNNHLSSADNDQNSNNNEQRDQVCSLVDNANPDNGLSITPDHFTVSKVHKIQQNQQYNSVKSDNFPMKQICFQPVQIQLPPDNKQISQQYEVAAIIPCVFQSIVTRKQPITQKQIKQEKQYKNKQKQLENREVLNKNESKVTETEKNKIITDVLLEKINQLQSKVKTLEQQKKRNQQILRVASQYQSTPNTQPSYSYGSIKKNDSAKKFSTVTDTQQVNNVSNQFRVRSMVNKALSNSSEYKICSNIYSMVVMDGSHQSNTIKQQLNILKQKLHALENAQNFNDQSIKESIRENNRKIFDNQFDQKVFSPSRKQLGGKIVKRSSSKLPNSPTNSYRTQTEESIYQAEKGFIRTGPQNFNSQDSKTIQASKYSNILQNQLLEGRKKIDSSAIFRKNPGPAIAHKNRLDQHNGKLSTLQFNSHQQQYVVMDSKESESQVLNYNQDKIADIYIPQLIPFPTPDSSSEELVQIGKLTFRKVGYQINEGTILNVKKFKNCVLFSIGHEQNILWHYEGKFYYGGWKTFANGQGQKYGKGVEFAPNKYKYKGHFVDGKRSGFGQMIGQNGTIYIGQWSEGFKHGKGKLIQTDGTQYEGEWKFGKKCGLGRLFNNGKIQFEGKFQNGYKNGFGKQYFQNGDYYEGSYLNNKFQGKGSYLWASKALYNGQFKDGKRHGHGVWRSGQKNYDTYEGQYLQDNKNGYGIYKWANGAIYKGSFKDDLKHGEGTITYENGKVVTMLWNKGAADKSFNSSQKFETIQKRHHNIIMTPKTNLRKGGAKSSSNLQSAKSLKSERSLPKGLSIKKDGQNLIEQKVQFRTKQHGGDAIRFKMSGDLNSNRQSLHRQAQQAGAGPLKDPPYKSMQTSSNINMNV